MPQTTGQGITSELYKAIVAIVDDRVREIRVTREDFDDLKQVVRELAQAQTRTEQRLDRLTEKIEELAEAQKRTEARVEELAEAQKRTEARVEELAQAQKRTEARVEELAEAQKKTEVMLARLTDEHRKTREMLGGLAHTVGYRLEDEAIWALPHLLARDFGMEIDGQLVRTFLETAPNRYVEVNIWGYGVLNGRRVAILGEAKSQLKKRDVDGFLKTMARVREISGMEVFPVLVTYQVSPKVKQAAAEKGIKVYLSYELRVSHGSS
jgi:flagellar biosynthesis GTPase FlhF